MKKAIYTLLVLVIGTGIGFGFAHVELPVVHAQTTAEETYVNEVTRPQAERLRAEHRYAVDRLEELKAVQRRWNTVSIPNDATVISDRGRPVTGADVWALQSQIDARITELEAEKARWETGGNLDVIEIPTVRTPKEASRIFQ